MIVRERGKNCEQKRSQVCSEVSSEASRSNRIIVLRDIALWPRGTIAKCLVVGKVARFLVPEVLRSRRRREGKERERERVRKGE